MNQALNQLNIEANEPKAVKKFMKGGEPFFHFSKDDVGVMLIHGFTATPYQFKELRDFLIQKNLTVSCPVIAGHGTSPEDLAKTTIDDWIISIEKAFKSLKEKVKRVIVIGNSFGGNLAFHLAVKNDDSLKGIISLGTPVFLHYHKIIYFRYYLYGWAKKFYRKQNIFYKPGYTDVKEIVSYPVIPVKSLKNLLNFLRYFTMKELKNVIAPTLIIQAAKDRIVHPKSAQYLHEFISSKNKKVYLVDDDFHSFHDATEKKSEIFNLIHTFIQEVIKNGH